MKIINFKTLRLLPSIGFAIYLIKVDSGRSFYALVPDSVIFTDDNIKEFKISNTLFEELVYCDF